MTISQVQQRTQFQHPRPLEYSSPQHNSSRVLDPQKPAIISQSSPGEKEDLFVNLIHLVEILDIGQEDIDLDD